MTDVERPAVAEPISFHFDPLCPWCWQTSRWIRQIRDLGLVEVTWAFFSLSIVNWDGPIPEFDPTDARGVAALRTAVAVRDGFGNDALDRYYASLGHRIWDEVASPDDVTTIEGALGDAGLDADLCPQALEDHTTWETVLREHTELCDETRSFGVPTIRLDGGTGPAIFGPVISNPAASDEEAAELWTHVAWLTRSANFSELKRERTIEPDLERFRVRARERATKS